MANDQPGRHAVLRRQGAQVGVEVDQAVADELDAPVARGAADRGCRGRTRTRTRPGAPPSARGAARRGRWRAGRAGTTPARWRVACSCAQCGASRKRPTVAGGPCPRIRPWPASPINLTNQFLIAMPGMADETFAGARGLPVRAHRAGRARPGDQQAERHQAEEPVREGRTAARPRRPGRAPVYFGGPVQTERGFVLHESRLARPTGADGRLQLDAVRSPAAWR